MSDETKTTTRQSSKKIWVWARLFIYVAVPLILLILPADFFDEGRPLCLSVILFNTECFGCGMTRAIMHLIHLEFNEAVFYNVGSFVIFPLMAYVWAKWFWDDFQSLRV